MYINIYRERETYCSLQCACYIMQMKRAAACGLGGYKVKSFKFERYSVIYIYVYHRLIYDVYLKITHIYNYFDEPFT